MFVFSYSLFTDQGNFLSSLLIASKSVIFVCVNHWRFREHNTGNPAVIVLKLQLFSSSPKFNATFVISGKTFLSGITRGYVKDGVQKKKLASTIHTDEKPIPNSNDVDAEG